MPLRTGNTPDMTHTLEALTWRHAFGVPAPAPETAGFQLGLIDEEYHEFLDAYHDADEAHTLKELSDLVFVCYQFAAAKGWNLDLALTRVFESNMSKLDIDGKPIRREDGKVLKGPGYFEPQLSDLIP
jgi:predicted HAD superfamily Cof-like phosphohydrolase